MAVPNEAKWVITEGILHGQGEFVVVREIEFPDKVCLFWFKVRTSNRPSSGCLGIYNTHSFLSHGLNFVGRNRSGSRTRRLTGTQGGDQTPGDNRTVRQYKGRSSGGVRGQDPLPKGTAIPARAQVLALMSGGFEEPEMDLPLLL